MRDLRLLVPTDIDVLIQACVIFVVFVVVRHPMTALCDVPRLPEKHVARVTEIHLHHVAVRKLQPILAPLYGAHDLSLKEREGRPAGILVQQLVERVHRPTDEVSVVTTFGLFERNHVGGRLRATGKLDGIVIDPGQEPGGRNLPRLSHFFHFEVRILLTFFSHYLLTSSMDSTSRSKSSRWSAES